MALNKPTGDMLNAGSDVAAQDLGTAAAGTSSSYSRADHVHKKPTAAEVGALSTSQLGVTVASLDGLSKLFTAQLPAITTSQISGLDTTLAGKVNTSQLGVVSGVATLDGAGKLTSAQIPALTTSQIAQITPVTIGAVATGDVIAIAKGGTGAITAGAARTALGITPANIGAIATDQASTFATLSSGTLRTDQMAALTGDVTSTAGNPATTVVKIQSQAISNATPGAGQVLTWDGAQWAPATSSGGGGGGANGLTYYFNQATAADAPTTNIPGTPHQLGRSGEAGQTTVTTGSLAQNTWTRIAGFISETLPQDPAVTAIPAGLWDTNFWCYGDANVAAGTSIRAVAYIYSVAGGGTLTALGSPSSAQVINGTSAQYSLSVLVPQTTILATDRIYIGLEAFATGNNHTVTAQFGDSTPSHIHTSLPLVGGTGLWKSVAGAVQSPATLLFNADVDPAAAIAVSKISGLATSATTDTTNASNITSGTLSTAQLATISGLPVGAQGSASAAPVVTVDTKGRVTALTTATITPAAIGAVSTGDVITIAKGGTGAITAPLARTALGITPANIGAIATDQASGFATLTGTTLTTSQMLALTGDVTTVAGSPATTLATISGLPTGAQGNSTTVPVITVDAKGRVTTLTTTAISGGGGGGTGIQMATVRHTSNITPAIAGTMTAAVWTLGSATVTFTATTATLVPGMSLNGSGISAFVIKSVDSATQITLSANATNSGAQNLNVYNSTILTMVTGTAPVIEGRTLIAGDVVLLASQSVLATGGPWVVVSNSGSSFSLSRPTWFQGTLSQPLFIGIQQGTSGGGYVYTVGQNSGLLGPLTIGVDSVIVAVTSSRAANAITGSNIFAANSTQTFGAGTATSVPCKFQAGVLLTTALAHAVEWENQSMYLTNASAIRKRVSYIEESVTSTAFATALNVDIDAQEIVLLTSAATANFTVNVRGSSTVAFNSIIEVGKSRSFVLLNTNTTTGWSISSISVDGVAQTVKWVNGISVGNVNSLDAWTITIIKTAASTYTVLASVAKYA